MTPIDATLIGKMSPARDILTTQCEAPAPSLWQLIGLVPGREQQRTSAMKLRNLLKAACYLASPTELGATVAARFCRAISGSEEKSDRRLIRGSLVAQRCVELVFDKGSIATPGEAFVLGCLVDNLLADGQALASVQQLSFCVGQRRYALAARSQHQRFGRVLLT